MVNDIDEYNNTSKSGRIGGVNVESKRTDGWANALMGLGKRGTDKTESTYYNVAPQFEDQELSEMYMGEGLGKRIIDLPAKDSVRAWIEVPADPEEAIINELNRLGAKQAFRKALSWARLYRGAVIVMMEKGGRKDLSKPLSINPQSIMALRVYSAARIECTTSDIVDDPHSKYFDDIEVFTIRKRNGTPMKVHASRCLIFKGEEAPDETTVDFKYKYWGIPVLMGIWDRLKNFGSIEKGIANLMLEFNIGKYTISNLASLLSQNTEDGLQQIYSRMEIINASKSLINSVLLGEGEEYTRDAASVSGVDAILDRFMIFLSAVSGIPVTRLWGRSPAGENATGESDMRQYYDDISAMQETQVEPPLNRLVTIIGGYLNVADTSFVFNPLWQPTESEQAIIDKTNAETDQIYINTAVRTPEDVQNERFPEEELPEPTEEE